MAQRREAQEVEVMEPHASTSQASSPPASSPREAQAIFPPLPDTMMEIFPQGDEDDSHSLVVENTFSPQVTAMENVGCRVVNIAHFVSQIRSLNLHK